MNESHPGGIQRWDQSDIEAAIGQKQGTALGADFLQIEYPLVKGSQFPRISAAMANWRNCGIACLLWFTGPEPITAGV
jgi:hypothetical protein